MKNHSLRFRIWFALVAAASAAAFLPACSSEPEPLAHQQYQQPQQAYAEQQPQQAMAPPMQVAESSSGVGDMILPALAGAAVGYLSSNALNNHSQQAGHSSHAGFAPQHQPAVYAPAPQPRPGNQLASMVGKQIKDAPRAAVASAVPSPERIQQQAKPMAPVTPPSYKQPGYASVNQPKSVTYSANLMPKPKPAATPAKPSRPSYSQTASYRSSPSTSFRSSGRR